MCATFTHSAGRHGVSEQDAIWAIEHALLAKPVFNVLGCPTCPIPPLFVGPDTTRRIIEVMAVRTDNDLIIFHAMRARPQFLDQIRNPRKGERR
ncbi:hypothetical protein C0Z10_13385 [Acidipropionibacterium jensenii]|uniref:Toxin n=1 Tax=Acidipropionibacterium jensenii TaxID=1749 RepID=A0A3Q9UJX8_9ACTN|nr:hypothetical protein C0Z10_13385 [Acidipropionibacterium jensenii]